MEEFKTSFNMINDCYDHRCHSQFDRVCCTSVIHADGAWSVAVDVAAAFPLHLRPGFHACVGSFHVHFAVGTFAAPASCDAVDDRAVVLLPHFHHLHAVFHVCVDSFHFHFVVGIPGSLESCDVADDRAVAGFVPHSHHLHAAFHACVGSSHGFVALGNPAAPVSCDAADEHVVGLPAHYPSYFFAEPFGFR